VSRTPYDAHLCAQNPTLWEAGFNFARPWVEKLAPPGKATEIHRVVKDSTGIPFPETAAKLGLQPGVFVEGFILGVYGVVALRKTAT